MAQIAMTVRMDNQQKAQFDKLCEQFGMSAVSYTHLTLPTKLEV